LQGGESVRLDLRGWRPTETLPVRRWDGIIEPGTLELCERSSARRFTELLSQSVRMHLRSDVAVGRCLSGGLDSSSIVCLMARELDALGDGARVHSVSACYDVKAVDERYYMEMVVDRASTTPHWCYPKVEDAYALAERITWHQDEPYGSTSIFAQWRVFEEARRAGLKVMLDGQRAGEQLAGYHGCCPDYFANLVRQRRFATLLRAMAERNAWHGVSFWEQVQEYLMPLAPPWLARWLRRQRQALAGHNWLNSEALHPH